MPKNYCPIFMVYSQYENGQNFLDTYWMSKKSRPFLYIEFLHEKTRLFRQTVVRIRQQQQ